MPGEESRRGRMARGVLGSLLASMAVGQTISFGAFVSALRDYRVVSSPLVPTLAVIVVTSETMVGFGLWRRSPPRSACIGALALTTWWGLAGLTAFARGLTVANCGCFGRFLSQELRWWVLLEDAEFVAFAFWAVWPIVSSARTSFVSRKVAERG